MSKKTKSTKVKAEVATPEVVAEVEVATPSKRGRVARNISVPKKPFTLRALKNSIQFQKKPISMPSLIMRLKQWREQGLIVQHGVKPLNGRKGRPEIIWGPVSTEEN
jgi:hypothetical protein